MKLDYELKFIEGQLKMFISTICTFQTFDSESIKKNLEEFYDKFKLIANNTKNLEDVDKEKLEKFGVLMKALELILQERYDLQKKYYEKMILNEELSNKEDSEKSDESDSSEESSIGSGDDNGKKVFRLKKSQLKILNKWFDSNIAHPYLTDKSTALLCKETGLTHSQVRNW